MFTSTKTKCMLSSAIFFWGVLGLIIAGALYDEHCPPRNIHFKLVPCLKWTAIENIVPGICKVIRYEQELIDLWKYGNLIQRCPCNQCPAVDNQTLTTCWYDYHREPAYRFRDTDRFTPCTKKQIFNYKLALALLGVVTIVAALYCLIVGLQVVSAEFDKPSTRARQELNVSNSNGLNHLVTLQEIDIPPPSSQEDHDTEGFHHQASDPLKYLALSTTEE